MEFYSATDYRKAIKYLIERENDRGEKTSLASLAEAVRVQRPYLSKVMSGSADLNSDQLYLVCKFFDLSETETEYLELLLDYSRATLKERKDLLKKKIQTTQAIHLDIKKHVIAKEVNVESSAFSEYYLNHHMQIVHIALNVKKYQNLTNLSEALGISKDYLLEILKKLEELGLVQHSKDRYTTTTQSIHLPKNSSLLRPHQSIVRMQSLQQLNSRGRDPGNYSFSVTFSGDEEIRKRIQEEFLKFLKITQKIVSTGDTEEIYQINFDLFSWTK